MESATAGPATGYRTPAYAPPPPPRGMGLGSCAVGCVFVLLVGGLGLSLLLNITLAAGQVDKTHHEHGVTEKYHSLDRKATNKVAIVRLEGPILDEDSFVRNQVEVIRRDDNVKAVVLRINSPGGTISGSDEIYHRLRQLLEEREIPMVVSMGGIAASGGYYSAMAVGDGERRIFAEPTTWTGSIGVIIPHYSFAGLMQEWKIEDDSIKSHPLKGVGSLTKTMTPEERAILQALVDDGFTRFKDVIKSGRKQFAEHPEQLDALATGQVFAAGDAKAKGLVDEIGYLDDAIARALELANLDASDAQAIEYRQQTGLLQDLLIGPSGSQTFAEAAASLPANKLDVRSVIELSTPRAYYLCTSLPPLEKLVRP
ncbi:MAG: signal peptide peptidase SppA [Pirellulales bacterium]|nr:signal peptide peptidase SppA [Pirellulales bacterium]